MCKQMQSDKSYWEALSYNGYILDISMELPSLNQLELKKKKQ